MRVASDVGGTFTDLEFRSYEAMATPGIINATVCAAKEGFDALAYWMLL